MFVSKPRACICVCTVFNGSSNVAWMVPAAKLAAAARVGDPLNASFVVTEGRNLLIDQVDKAHRGQEDHHDHLATP